MKFQNKIINKIHNNKNMRKFNVLNKVIDTYNISGNIKLDPLLLVSL
jgi:hypothetical protein